MPSKRRLHLNERSKHRSHIPTKSSDASFLWSRRWRRLRLCFLAANPLCVECLSEGLTVSATQVDHVIARSADPSMRYDWKNLRALCASCHSRRTRSDQPPGSRGAVGAAQPSARQAARRSDGEGEGGRISAVRFPGSRALPRTKKRESFESLCPKPAASPAMDVNNG
jgi:5-methylcytosine-specific restriction protein A